MADLDWRGRLLLPGRAMGALGALLVTGIAVFELGVPAGAGGWLLGLAGIFGLAGLSLDALFQRQNFKVLRRFARSSGAASREGLQAAAREIAGARDRMFAQCLFSWGAGLLVMGAASSFVPGVSTAFAVQLALLGVVLGPVLSIAAHVWTARIAHRAFDALGAAGLSPQDLISALPPGRHRLGGNLRFFVVVAVLAPSTLAVWVSLRHANATLDALAATDDAAAREALLAEERPRQLVPVAIFGGLLVAFVLAAARTGARAFEESLRAASAQATRIAEGDLSRLAVVPAEDELWSVCAAFSGMHTHLAGVLSQLQRAGVKIASTTEQIVQMSTRHQKGSTEQAAALNETMATTEELARSGRQIADSAGAVARIAEETLAAARAGRKNAESFAESMGRMKQDNQGIADSVVRLNKRVQQIGKIVEFITGIADKSDLLALNAELEGTKAGEVGRGFSLVAAEMRRIAENVIDSTRQISKLIEEIRDATNAAVMATEAGVKATEVGALHSAELSGRLGTILDFASATSDAIRAISLATQQQQAGTDQLALAMGNVVQVTQQAAQQTQQLQAANSDLISLSGDLKTVVGRFRVSG